MRFSERQGLRSVRTVLQIDSMDDALRNRLWNLLDVLCWKSISRDQYVSLNYYQDLTETAFVLWHDYFKEPTDTIPTSVGEMIAEVRERYFSYGWYEVYDLLEFAANYLPAESVRARLIRSSNEVLEAELSAYRFIGGKLIRVTEKTEVDAIEKAIKETASAFPGASHHLRTAIDLLARKPKSDHRNSIKESISAVESLCVSITGDEKATLAKALKAIDPKAELHGALREAFSKLYGYTSDADGIRHALLEEDHLEQEDAVFMLVACSAFISYVIAKHARKR